MRTALFWVITQSVVEIPCRRFVTTYRSIFKGQDKMGARGSETSVRNFNYALCNNPEERDSEHHMQGMKQIRSCA